MENFSHIHDTFQWDPNSGIPPIRIHPKTPSRRAKNATASRDQKRDVQMAARCGAMPLLYRCTSVFLGLIKAKPPENN